MGALSGRSWGGFGNPSKSAQSSRSQSRQDPLSGAGVEPRSKSKRTKTQSVILKNTDAEIDEDPDAKVEMDYGSAAEATGSMSSMYEPNTESQSTVAGNDEPPAEDQPVAGATEEDVDGKIFHVCTTGQAYVVNQTEDG